MRGLPLVVIGSLLFLASACGAPFEQNASATVATDSADPVPPTIIESTTTSSSLPPGTVEATTTTAPDAMTKHWLYPSSDPPGVHLIYALRQVVPDCGMIDCGLMRAIATLVYESNDPTERRLQITQSSRSHGFTSAPPPTDALDTAPERSVGDRSVRVVEGVGDVRAAWTEPDGDVVRVDSVGLAWDELAAMIGGLQPVDPAAWPTVEWPPTIGPCVDASSQIAPTTPDGWQRFVLQARPTGNCDPGPILVISLVRPGKLVTITLDSAGVPAPLGDPVMINGNKGFLSVSAMADGTPTASITIDIGGVPVEAHGTADKDQLVAIIASFHQLDATEWADIVSSVVQPP
jgi:hypothetical protein